MRLILGSASKARERVLLGMGWKFEKMSADIDEKAIRRNDPKELTLALARAKADALLPRISGHALLITSDQVVVCNGMILEKPRDAEEVKRFFALYAEHPVATVTSVVVTDTETGDQVVGVDVAYVIFAPIIESELERYIATGDPMNRAGGFDPEHPIIIPYVSDILGEPESITGLPAALTRRLVGQMRRR